MGRRMTDRADSDLDPLHIDRQRQRESQRNAPSYSQSLLAATVNASAFVVHVCLRSTWAMIRILQGTGRTTTSQR
jgi:hypothetical protein